MFYVQALYSRLWYLLPIKNWVWLTPCRNRAFAVLHCMCSTPCRIIFLHASFSLYIAKLSKYCEIIVYLVLHHMLLLLWRIFISRSSWVQFFSYFTLHVVLTFQNPFPCAIALSSQVEWILLQLFLQCIWLCIIKSFLCCCYIAWSFRNVGVRTLLFAFGRVHLACTSQNSSFCFFYNNNRYFPYPALVLYISCSSYDAKSFIS